jgi:hypothetical protein
LHGDCFMLWKSSSHRIWTTKCHSMSLVRTDKDKHVIKPAAQISEKLWSTTTTEFRIQVPFTSQITSASRFVTWSINLNRWKPRESYLQARFRLDKNAAEWYGWGLFETLLLPLHPLSFPNPVSRRQWRPCGVPHPAWPENSSLLLTGKALSQIIMIMLNLGSWVSS